MPKKKPAQNKKTKSKSKKQKHKTIKSKRKNTPGHNTFRFKPFHERIANISIDVTRKLARHNVTPDNSETFFEEELKRWRELNCSQDFYDFLRSLKKPPQSFVEVVHHQNHIVSCLLEHLKRPDTLALQPLAALLVALARDLQSDFYPHFEQVLQTLVFLLNLKHHDSEALEEIFSCLGHMFKFLWRIFVKNIHELYGMLSPLLGRSYQSYINAFAAESFAFLLRKVKIKDEIFQHMLKDVAENNDRREGTARLLFEAVKGVSGLLISDAERSLDTLLNLLERDDSHEGTIARLWKMLAEFTSKDGAHGMFQTLLQHLNQSQGHYRTLLGLLDILIQNKSGALISSSKSLEQIYTVTIKAVECVNEAATDVCLQVCADVLKVQEQCLSVVQRSVLTMKVYNSQLSVRHVLDFTRDIVSCSFFEMEVLPLLLAYCSRVGLSEHFWSCVQLLVEVCLSKVEPPTCPLPQQLIYHPGDWEQVLSWQRGKDDFYSEVYDKLLATADSSDGVNLQQTWALLVTVQYSTGAAGRGQRAGSDQLTSLLARLVSAVPTRPDASVVLYQALLTCSKLLPGGGHTTHLALDQLLTGQPPAHAVMSVYLISVTAGLTPAQRRAVSAPLWELIASPYSTVRLPALLTCAALASPGEAAVLEQCIVAEQTPGTVHGYRDRLRHLNKLAYPGVKEGAREGWTLRYLISNLYINMKLIWPEIIEIIKTYAEGMPEEHFWQVKTIGHCTIQY